MRLRRALAFVLLAVLPALAFGAPSVSTITTTPIPLTPGTPFEVRVEASDVTAGFVYVDFRPLAASLLRLPVTLNEGVWTATGVVPATLRPTANSTASIQALMTKGAQRATKTVKVAFAPQSGGGVTPPSTIAITSPANLATVNSLQVAVTGTISANQGGIIQVNGAPAQLTGTAFSATVELHEGNNSISAVLTDGQGRVSTATIQVTVDTEPPRLTIDSPRNGAILSEAQTAVSGMINDTVVGTVNGDQATVHVNGMPAVIANRTFVVMNVPLIPGENLIEAIGTDRVGNRGTNVIRVTYAPAVGNRLQIVSGDGQSARIGDLLPQPLVVRAIDADGNPIQDKTVIFKVIQNDGVVTGPAGTARSVLVDTDANGQARVQFRLGVRAGAGNNQVSASIVGFQTEPVFCASATPGPPGLLVLDAGNNQIGSVSQPLPRALATIIVDAGNNRLHNVPVTFRVLEGGGNFGGQSSTTLNSDSDGRAVTSFTLGPNAGNDNNRIEATFPGNTGIPVVFVASARLPGNPAETSISGVVLDNSDIPVPGAILRILGHPVATRSDENGYFQIKPAPVGAVRLIADGSTVTRPGSWVWLQFDLVTIAGHDNDIGMPVRLLPIDTVNGIHVDETHGGTLTLPHAPGYSLTVISNSAAFPNGTHSGTVSVTIVHPDKMPDPPSFGQQPRFLVSIQPANTVFNPPAPMCLPNLDALPPGQKTDMYSYDHDMGRFVSIGTGTISDDGMLLCSDPGNGVIKGGWHCGGNPAQPGSGVSASVNIMGTPSLPPCVNEAVTLTASGAPPGGSYSWSGGGTPAAGSSATFQTQYTTAGTKTVTVVYTCPNGATASDSTTLEITEFDYYVGRCVRNLGGWVAPTTITVAGVTIPVPDWLQQLANGLVADHHDVVVEKKDCQSGAIIERFVRGFFADDFNDAIVAFIKSQIPLVGGDGFVPGSVKSDSDGIPTTCAPGEVTKQRFDQVRTRILTPANRYNLGSFQCQHWAAQQLAP